MSWSPQQESAIKAVRAWMKTRDKQVFRLFGFAGTGKTTLARDLASGVKGDVLFGAFTGKAAHVLQRKGCEGASTIHSLIYRVDEREDSAQPQFLLNKDSAVGKAKLVIIDECSMVGDDLARDLMSFGTKILVLGDPAQLPPVKGSGFFTNAEPDAMLTEVHRQAQDNPIIAMSMQIREGGSLKLGVYGESRVIERAQIDAKTVVDAGQVIVGLNRTRTAYNKRIRSLLGRTSDTPAVSDKLVCLRNDRDLKLLNGGLWSVQGIAARGNEFQMKVLPEDADADVKATKVAVRREFFEGDGESLPWEERRGTQEFTYGYALTCHKSQGSQWNDVVVFDESGSFRDHRTRWLYTAVTRAAERVTVVQV